MARRRNRQPASRATEQATESQAQEPEAAAATQERPELEQQSDPPDSYGTPGSDTRQEEAVAAEAEATEQVDATTTQGSQTTVVQAKTKAERRQAHIDAWSKAPAFSDFRHGDQVWVTSPDKAIYTVLGESDRSPGKVELVHNAQGWKDRFLPERLHRLEPEPQPEPKPSRRRRQQPKPQAEEPEEVPTAAELGHEPAQEGAEQKS